MTIVQSALYVVAILMALSPCIVLLCISEKVNERIIAVVAFAFCLLGYQGLMQYSPSNCDVAVYEDGRVVNRSK